MKKAVWGVVAFFILVLALPLGLVAILSALGSGQAAMAACNGTAGAVAGVPAVLDGDKRDHVRTTIGVAKTMGITDQKAWTIAIVTMLVESRFENVPPGEGDADSVGLYQQRPSQGWGTPEQLSNPVYAAMVFFEGAPKQTYQARTGTPGLLDVGYQQRSIGDAAARTQSPRADLEHKYGLPENVREATALAQANADAPPVSLAGLPRKNSNAAAGAAADGPAPTVVQAGATTAAAGTWVMPIAEGEYTVSQAYGNRNGTNSAGWHTGTDFAADLGTPVRSATAGVVTFSGQQGDFGNLVLVEPAKGTTVGYHHLREPSLLKVGDRVTAGQPIGVVGSTGESASPHLQFEVRTGVTDPTSPTSGRAVDPLAWLRGSGSMITPVGAAADGLTAEQCAEILAAYGGAGIVGAVPANYNAGNGGNKAWGVGGQTFRNGYIPEALNGEQLLCPIDFEREQKLRCDAARDLGRLNKAFKAQFGHDFRTAWGYRSFAHQVRVRHERPGLAAVPGRSNHGWGMAADLGIEFDNKYQWMLANAGQYGWSHPSWARANGSKPEPWHWEYSPPASAAA